MTSTMIQSRQLPAIAPLSVLNPVVGSETKELARRVAALHSRPSPGSLLSSASRVSSVEEQLFDALANVKVLTAQVAMHLDREWRLKLFRQLDSLLDPDEWEEGDLPLRPDSFVTFLKGILAINPPRRPGLGLSSTGNLVAAWTTDRDRLTIQFLPGERVTWVLSRYDCDGQAERFAGEVDVARLNDSLLSYHPEHWFTHVQSDTAA